MEPQSLLTLTKVLLAVILVLVAYSLRLVFKLKDIDPFKNWNPNQINGFLMLAFLVVGLIAAFWSTGAWSDMFYMIKNPASEHGVWIDGMFERTTWVIVIATIITNILLFWFAFKYRMREGNKALFYPHNNKLELIWTVVPAIVMTILIADGVRNWHKIMAPDEEYREQALDIEFYGKQFDWTFRYTGPDKELGQTHIKYIDVDKGNTLGFNFEDPRTHDDLQETELHLPVNVPVHMHIKSQDVLHSATLMHFRVKMDAVPGMPTKFWFTPTVTTDSMRRVLNDPEFNYEMSCQQICGSAHYNMRREVVVESMEEYQAWLKTRKPYYAIYQDLNAPAKPAPVPVPEPEAEPAQANEGVDSDQLSEETEKENKPITMIQ